MFPDCASHLACIQDGRVIYRICDKPDGPHYRQCVDASICLRCAATARPEPTTAPAPEPAPLRESAQPPPLQRAIEARTPRASESDAAPQPPGLVRRAISYAEALAQWTAAGRPERSAKDVEQIFNQFCKPCRWFDRRRRICRGCGCRVADSGFAILNKIKMVTERCPKNLW